MGIWDSALGTTSEIQEPRDFQCPNCGAWASEGGCEDLEECIDAIIRLQDLYISEIRNLLDTSNTPKIPVGDPQTTIAEAKNPKSCGSTEKI